MTLNLCQAGHTTHDSKLVDTAYGPFWIWDWEKYRDQFNTYCTGQDDVSMSLDLYGDWERPDIARMRSILDGSPTGSVVDYGAHIGWYAIQAAALGWSVISVEADPENARLLEMNRQLRDIPEDRFLIQINWAADSVLVVTGSIRFLKSDVEGAEDEVVYKTRPLWQDRLIDHALLEISPVFKPYYPALVDELASYGYKPYIIKDEGDWEITGSDVVFPQENVHFSKRP